MNNFVKVNFQYSELLEKYLIAHHLDYVHFESQNIIKVFFDNIYDLVEYSRDFIYTKDKRGYVCAWKQFEDTEENISLSQTLNIEDFKLLVKKYNDKIRKEREIEHYEFNNR
jgi:hypothetical protein